MKRGISILLYGLLFIFSGLGLMGMVEAKSDVKRAVIVIDPGISGFSLRVAQDIANRLSDKKVQAKLVKANDFKSSDLSNADLLVIGGPTYAHRPSNSIKRVMSEVDKPGLKTILFQTGGTHCEGLKPLIELAVNKDLQVIGSDGILFNKRDASYIEVKVNGLLEKL